MKRIIAAVMIVFLVLPGFAAAASWGEQTGNGGGNPAAGDRQLVRTEENETFGDRMQQRVAENTTPGEKEFIPDRNRVRLAVHALLAAENRTGGIGQNVSAIAREVNN
ncbi:MAG: hypothetical protein M0P17_10290, partial [Methanoculleus sp.]|nr:hypothetical protein [Methanoculleus sp.]